MTLAVADMKAHIAAEKARLGLSGTQTRNLSNGCRLAFLVLGLRRTTWLWAVASLHSPMNVLQKSRSCPNAGLDCVRTGSTRLPWRVTRTLLVLQLP